MSDLTKVEVAVLSRLEDALAYRVWVDDAFRGVFYGKPRDVVRTARAEYGGRKVTVEGDDMVSEAFLNHRIRTVRFQRRLDDRVN
jgi:hypothetical protein